MKLIYAKYQRRSKIHKVIGYRAVVGENIGLGKELLEPAQLAATASGPGEPRARTAVCSAVC